VSPYQVVSFLAPELRLQASLAGQDRPHRDGICTAGTLDSHFLFNCYHVDCLVEIEADAVVEN